MPRTQIPEFPIEFRRTVDFFACQGLQTRFDEQQRLFFFRGHTSPIRTIGITKRGERSDLGVEYSVDPVAGNRVKVKFGMPLASHDVEPDDVALTSRELIGDFEDMIPEIVESGEITIGKRGTIHDIPSSVNDLQELQGVDNLFQYDQAWGSSVNKVRKLTGLRVTNAYRLMKPFLVLNNIPLSIYAKRLKSTLYSLSILPSNDAGYMSLAENLPRIETAITQGREWQDVAEPVRYMPREDGTGILIFLLQRKQKLIGL